MNTIITLFGFLIIALSIWGIVSPEKMLKYVSDFVKQPSGIYFAVAIRIALGLVFILAAEHTRTPEVMNFLGYLMIIAAAAIALLGRDRMSKFIDWWMKRSGTFARGWLLFGILFGVFLVYTAN